MIEVLRLLEMGCEIHFSSGYMLRGNPSEKSIYGGYLYCGEYIADTSWPLDLKGYHYALATAKAFNILDEQE